MGVYFLLSLVLYLRPNVFSFFFSIPSNKWAKHVPKHVSLFCNCCHKPHLSLHSAVHQRMRYHVKTINGLSPSYCSHNPPHSPFWGAGQGACDAAARCTAMSSCIFSAYQQRCHHLLMQERPILYSPSSMTLPLSSPFQKMNPPLAKFKP